MATVASLGFDADFYLQEKAAQMGASTTEALAAITAAGLTLEEHYLRYGYQEGLSPNKYFNADQYAAAKAAQMGGGATAATFINAWYAASGSTNVYFHYLMYGDNEGVSPSNGFDENAYYVAKAAQMGGGATAADAKAAIEGAGLTALTHYMLYGINESLSYTPTPIGVTGQTYTLTTGPDTIVGTAYNDTINGVTASTLTATDTINGNGGTDTLNVTDTAGTAGVTNGALISDVEVVNIREVGAGTGTFDASTWSGITNVNAYLNTGNVTITKLATGAAAGIIGNGTLTEGALNFGYATPTAAATLNLQNGTKAGAVTITSAPTAVTVNSTGASNTITSLALGTAATALQVNATTNLTTGNITGFAGTTAAINVSGTASSVNLGTIENATVKTVDASGLIAGGITATLSTNTGIVVTGGSGNDTIGTGAVLTTGSVDAGAGTADRLVVNGAHIGTAAVGAKYTNFEILQNAAAAAQDVSLVSGITSVELNANGAGASNLTAAQAAAVTNMQDNTGATLSLATATGTSDVLAVTLQNSTATASADLLGATVDGFETMNVTSSSGTSADISALSFTSADSLTALNLTGAKPISVNTAGLTAKAVAIDASDLTYVGSTATDYALTITGNLLKGSSVTGSDAADSITTTGAVTGTTGDYVTYSAGAGNDAISSTIAAINNTSVANASVKIDGGAGTDTLTLTDATPTLVDANFQYLTNIEALSLTGAGAVSLVSGGFFNTNYSTNGIGISDTAIGDANATVNLTTFTGNATVSLTSGSTTNATTVVTGSGNDTISVSDTALTSGSLSLTGGSGNDTITATVAAGVTGTISLDGGAGQDAITISGVAATDQATVDILTHAGQSTLSAYDTITGYGEADGVNKGMVLDFDGAATVAANVVSGAVQGYTSAELTYAITGGVLSFSGTSASSLTNDLKASIASTVVTTGTASVGWADGSNTYIFNNNASGDSLIKLAGVTTLGGLTNAAALTNNYVSIA